jgi:hypothetical protein
MKEPQELTSTEQERLTISAYWPQIATEETPIGYGGLNKRFIIAECIGLLLTLSSRFVRLPVGSRFIALNPWLRVSFMLVMLLLLFLPGGQQRKKIGFYQLDAHGTPTHYIGRFPPASIRGHIGLSRKRFFQPIG